MATMVSPGVYINEVDLSTYVATMSASKIVAIIGTAQNGPANVATSVASIKEFESTFGNPIDYGGLAAVTYLSNASSLYYVRMVGESASQRSVTIAGTDTSAQAVASALTIKFKNKGTIYADTVTATVAAVTGESTDVFKLTITKGTDTTLLDGTYSILSSSTTNTYIGSVISDVFDFTVDATATALTAGTQSFSAGDNGTTLTDDQKKAAIDALSDSESIDIDVVSIPGEVSSTIVSYLVAMCNTRKDCIAVLDTPVGLTPTEAAEFIDGVNTTYQITKVDSTYAAMYYPWGYMYNNYKATSEYVPASVGVLAAMGKEYLNYDVWTPPAGYPRFAMSAFAKMERTLSKADRDILYASNINPICNYKNTGLTAMGQKTTQRALTATNRVNVRFLINYVKKIADFSTIPFLFMNIEDNTFTSWTQVISKQLDVIKNKGGMYDYKVTMDDTTVTQEMINNNTMPGIIQVKPTKSAEFISIDVKILNKDATFE